ncbi:hypothetical protein [Halorussus amylolyticus]|uniref:hypothetical protein n=1 Tax=Halorussus amylolyticus TaxID=1126242 RepID=UPI001045494A|nr:hypothetical protein [Halorussus amylolyticus]
MSLQTKRLAAEGAPVAATLFFWHLLAVFAGFQNVGGPVRTAGVVMAVAYVTLRGVALSTKTQPLSTEDARAVLSENVRVAVPAGLWFVAAMAVGALEVYVAVFTGTIAAAESALAGAGLGVVGLYAVAAGYAAIRERRPIGATSTDD